MIFATVGAQLPFDRMMMALDEWAFGLPDKEILAQIGATGWQPRHMRWVRSMNPRQFRATCEAASLIVAHAGMGTILMALEMGKPILVMPRRAALHETRNDHQVATMQRLEQLGRVVGACNEQELVRQLDDMVQRPCIATDEELREGGCRTCRLSGSCSSADRIAPYASSSLLSSLREFIEWGTPARPPSRRAPAAVAMTEA